MDQNLTGLVDAFLDSYALCGGINHLDGVNLPSKVAVGDLTQDLLQLLFPGFIEDRAVSRNELPIVITELLYNIRERLEVELAKSLDYAPTQGKTAREVSRRFLEELVKLRCILQTDVEAAFEGDPAAVSTDEVMVAYPGVEAIAVQRMAHLLYTENVVLIPRMMTEWAHARTGIDIHPGATIGTHFFIDHGTGVVIGETCVIGDHVRIYQGVTLGAKSVATTIERDMHGQATTGKRHPTIGNHITIYPNATILGGDTVVGDNSVIGGNVWLSRSVPPDSLVIIESQQVLIRSRSRSAEVDYQV